MKLYRRMVKPMIMFPDSHYRPCYKGIPDENWYPEEDIPILKEKYKHLENTFEHIVFDERYEVQEPRMLTLDEVISAELGTVIWLEGYNKPTIIPGLVDSVFIMEKMIDFQLVKMIDFQLVRIIVTADLDEYGERWRCWTERPTDEQRIVTPWENKEGGCNGDYCEIN